MSDQDKTLKETVTEALQTGNNDTTQPQPTETEQGISGEDTTGETQSGGTPEYVSGIDISDIPEQDRPRIKELLTKKAKLLEDGYQAKFKEVANFKKAQEELVTAGLSVEEARDVLMKHIDNKRNPKPATAEEKKEAIKTLDQIASTAPAEQRAEIMRLRTIIQEESNSSVIQQMQKQLDEVMKKLQFYEGTATETKRKQAESELVSFSEKYGQELVDKYRNIILDRAVQYPNMSLGKIFSIEVPLEEIEQAILSKSKKPLTNEKKNAITSPSSRGVTSSKEKIDVSKLSYAELMRQGTK